jgi:hypothetical protein
VGHDVASLWTNVVREDGRRVGEYSRMSLDAGFRNE